MKRKSILTIAIIITYLSAMAQTKQPIFKVPFTQQDMQQQYQSWQYVSQKLHTLHIDGLLRDTLDNTIGKSVQLIQMRYREAFVADSLANVKPKKP